jgi:signal transduction histidine kinase
LCTAAYRIVQEALTNVMRHAEADRIAIRLQEDGDTITLTVTDDGKGIDSARVREGLSFGIIGMRERAQALGGRFFISSVPGNGTTVTARFPLKSAEPQPEIRQRGLFTSTNQEIS